MKKIILLFLTSLFLINCQDNNPYEYLRIRQYFYDCINFGDTLYFSTYCDVSKDSVKLSFTKKEYVLKDSTIIHMVDKTYIIRNDTLIIYIENSIYNIDEFISVLNEKNKIERTDSIFKFTPNMYCRWKFFDEIYNYVMLIP